MRAFPELWARLEAGGAFWADGAGNRFVLLDGLSALPAEAGEWAQALCDPQAECCDRLGRRPDGLVILKRPSGADGPRMVIFNADGSRPEACGNALRCVAAHLFAQAPRSIQEWHVETDAGRRRIWRAGTYGVRVSMGAARMRSRATTLDVEGRSVMGFEVDMGNPHFVIPPGSVEASQVAWFGPRLSQHPHFSAGTNVEFVCNEAAPWVVRVWERGVGETEACGSGACAVAHAMSLSAADGNRSGPCEISMPGGTLVVTQDEGELVLSGDATVVPWKPIFPLRGLGGEPVSKL
ncbi:MAG TPA: diaminopimelate epimerase [Planctomycetota bacterium]|nr:diaminopimelate epimerase [Planctomycetota bacterium]